ncbi:MAG: hypothetical protein EA379_01395 [Phycisphaerales bacterium]|nr:MAG: hypothetical protein EA379_01395 [Phycisphaerales bacterium]
MSEPMLWWGVALFGAAFVVLILEAFVPSAGVISVVSGMLAVAGVVCFWRVSPLWGVSSLVALLILAPIAVGFLLRIWPDTYVGRRMILSDTDEETAERAGATAQEAEGRRSLVGVEGVALTDMHPTGVVRIGAERIEASSEHGAIDEGARVRVTAVEGRRVVVRAIG